MNLARELEENAAGHPERVALHFNDRSWTYAQVNDRIGCIANGLSGLGVRQGDRVAIMMPNWPEFHMCTHAAWRLGAIQVPINVMFRAEEVSYILNDAQVTAIVTYPESAQTLQNMRAELPHLKAVVVLGGDGPTGTVPFEEMVTEANSVCPACELSPEHLAMIPYTSGTTGFPKGAMHSHYRVLYAIQNIQDYFGLTDTDTIMQALPAFQGPGSLSGILLAWHLGSTAVLVERIQAQSLAETIRRTRPAFFALVPTVLYDTVNLPEDVPVDFSSVRYIVYGAAPTPPGLREGMEQRFGVKMVQAYGMTEQPCYVAIDPLDRPAKLGATGIPLKYHVVKIVDEDNNPLPVGEVGEICVAPQTEGPYAGKYKLLAGYWQKPEPTLEVLKGGLFHTGDLGKIDEDGFLYVVDRKKDMIIRGGHNIFPAELERVLMTDPRVVEAYVVGVSDARLGEVPKAFIVLKPGAEAREEEFVELIATRLAKYKRLEYVEFIDRDSLPRNAMGKVLKRQIKTEQGDAR